MTVSEGSGSASSRVVKRRYPVKTGLVAGTTKTEGRRPFLFVKSSKVLKRTKLRL